MHAHASSLIGAAGPRSSPLLDGRGEEQQLPHAPPPWILKKCLHTDLIFLSNPPAYGELSENFAYEVTFEQESRQRRQAEPIRYAFSTALKRFRARVQKRNKILAMVRRLVTRSAAARIEVLDVGCGWGSLLQDLMAALPPDVRQRCAPHGVEISRALAAISNDKLAPLGGRCVHAAAGDGLLQFGQTHFDIIIMASYLEHEINPIPVLRHCLARLKPGGLIVLKVPNYACWNRRLRGDRWCGFRWPDHVNYFTPDTLKRTAAVAGLEIERMSLLDTSPLNDNMYAVLKARGGA